MKNFTKFIRIFYTSLPVKIFNEVRWNEDLGENIFDYIRKSEAFAYAKNQEYIKVEIYSDET